MKQSAVRDFSVSEYRKTIKFEYRVYFALIFLISIPLNNDPNPIITDLKTSL